MVIGEDDFKSAALPPFEVLDVPDNLALLEVAVSIAIFTIFDLRAHSRLATDQLLGNFVQGIHVVDVFEAEDLVLLG